MPVTSYYSFGGEILGEETGGVRRDYLTDALGSVTATVTGAGAVENTYRYKPYGELLAKTGTGNDPKFLWNGKWGYRNQNSSYYVRHRYYLSSLATWMSSDPFFTIIKQVNSYLYCNNNSICLFDFSGRDPIWIPRKPRRPGIENNMSKDCSSGANGVTQCDLDTGISVSAICPVIPLDCGGLDCLKAHEGRHRESFGQNKGACCDLVYLCVLNKKASPITCATLFAAWQGYNFNNTECKAFKEGDECCKRNSIQNKCGCEDDKNFCTTQSKLRKKCCDDAVNQAPCPFKSDGTPDYTIKIKNPPVKCFELGKI